MMHPDPEDSFMVFAIAGYQLALPIEAVLRVVKFPADRELSQVGLVQIGRHLVSVVDLERGLSDNPARSAFLVVTVSLEGDLQGIAVSEPPSLVKFSRTLLQRLPASRPPSRLLDLTSHTAVIDREGSSTTLFLLDLGRTFRPQLAIDGSPS